MSMNFVDRFVSVPVKLETKARWEAVNMRPSMAERFLSKVHPNQRPEKPHRVKKYARDMAAGEWWLNHADAITIDEDGYLTNGRNRCLACIRAGVVVPMVICYNAERRSAVIYDTGAGRNVNDAACFDGSPMDNKQFSAVARRMVAGLRNRAEDFTVQQVLEGMKLYVDGIRFSFQPFAKGKSQGLLVAGTRAVIARAYYTADRDRLFQFGQQLVTGLPDDPKRDQAVILLRNWLLETNVPDKRRSQGGRFDRKLTYSLTEYALENFLVGWKITSLSCVSDEKFPLPEAGKSVRPGAATVGAN